MKTFAIKCCMDGSQRSPVIGLCKQNHSQKGQFSNHPLVSCDPHVVTQRCAEGRVGVFAGRRENLFHYSVVREERNSSEVVTIIPQIVSSESLHKQLNKLETGFMFSFPAVRIFFPYNFLVNAEQVFPRHKLELKHKVRRFVQLLFSS